MRKLLLIFTCKRPKLADTGGGGVKKRSNFADILYGWPLTNIASRARAPGTGNEAPAYSTRPWAQFLLFQDLDGKIEYLLYRCDANSKKGFNKIIPFILFL